MALTSPSSEPEPDEGEDADGAGALEAADDAGTLGAADDGALGAADEAGELGAADDGAAGALDGMLLLANGALEGPELGRKETENEPGAEAVADGTGGKNEEPQISQAAEV